MSYNVEYISTYIPDEACEVCRVGRGNIPNERPAALFIGSVVSAYSCDLKDSLRMTPQSRTM